MIFLRRRFSRVVKKNGLEGEIIHKLRRGEK
jgi:hypothetical protein